MSAGIIGAVTSAITGKGSAQPDFYTPPPLAARQQADFNNPLCSCFSDSGMCFKAFCCFPCFASENSARLDNNLPFLGCCYPFLWPKNRVQTKAQLGIRVAEDDCCVGWCCPFCSEIQVRKELELRAADPTIKPVAPEQRPHPDFRFPLFGCLTECSLACGAFCCLPCFMTKTSADMDSNQNICMCLYPGLPWKNRVQAKAKYGIKPQPCADCLLGWVCPFCSEIQVRREINSRSASHQLLAAAGVQPGPAAAIM